MIVRMFIVQVTVAKVVNYDCKNVYSTGQCCTVVNYDCKNVYSTGHSCLSCKLWL